MFNKSRESGHLCIVPDLGENAFNFSPLRNNVCSGLVIHGFYYFEIGSLYALFLEIFFFFIRNLCWILSEPIFASVEIIIWFLLFSLLIWCITLIDMPILKNPCIPGINLTWSWWMTLMCISILFAKIL